MQNVCPHGLFEALGRISDVSAEAVMVHFTSLPHAFCFAERLAAAKEENVKIHATLDATLQDLNNF